MDARRFIYQLIDHFPSPLRTPARWVADVVFGVWDDLSGVFRLTVPFWARFFDAATGFANNLVSAVVEAALTARWLVGQWIPSFVLDKVGAARDWIIARLVDVRWFLEGLINGAIEFAHKGINNALDFTTKLRDWAWGLIKGILDTLSTVARLVGDLLTDPSKLAAWAAGAMFWALLRVADALIEPIVEYVWARRQNVILRVLSRIESVIARIL